MTDDINHLQQVGVRGQPWIRPHIYPLGLADTAAGGTEASADGFAGSMSFPTTS
ncbi:MAG: hypothetical protein K0U64_02900 [Actinomycetia bacterium]|nr:hypothetical protein [Actinomycetes bacterium]